QGQLLLLTGKLGAEVRAGRFEQAHRLAGQRLALLRVRGENHPDVEEARREAERWRKLAAAPARSREEAVRGLPLPRAAAEGHARRRYVEAARAYREAAGIFSRVLGPDDVDVGTTLGNAAQCLRAAGDPEALPLARQALAIHRKALGD